MSIARSEPLRLPGLAWPIELRVHPRASTLRLRLDEKRQLLTLTCPPRASRRAALVWAGNQSEWVERQLAALAQRITLEPGSRIPFDGIELLLDWRESESRRMRLEDGKLIGGGPSEGFGRRVARWLRAEAQRRLAQETADIAAAAGVAVAGVSTGDPATRWGSCSAGGRIRYSWRLLLAPPELRRYVVAHEVAHRVHMNHGAEFHALEATLYGGPVASARLALRRLGPGLKRIDLPV